MLLLHNTLYGRRCHISVVIIKYALRQAVSFQCYYKIRVMAGGVISMLLYNTLYGRQCHISVVIIKYALWLTASFQCYYKIRFMTGGVAVSFQCYIIPFMADGVISMLLYNTLYGRRRHFNVII